MSIQKQYTEKKYKNMFFCFAEDDNDEIVQFATTEKNPIGCVSIEKCDKNCKNKGELSIYQYDRNKNDTRYVTQEEFVAKYLDNDNKTGSKIFTIIKTKLNRLGEKSFTTWDDIKSHGIDKQDNNRRYIIIYDYKETNFLFGLNIDRVYANMKLSDICGEYEELVYTLESDFFKLETKKNGSTIIFLDIVKQFTKEEIEQIVKDFIYEMKKHNQKIVDPSKIKIILSYFPYYEKLMQDYKAQIDKLIQDVLAFTNNGTKRKKFEYRTEQENNEVSNFKERESELNNIFRQSYHKGVKLHEMIKSMKSATERMRKWEPTTSWGGGKYEFDINISDVSELKNKNKSKTIYKEYSSTEQIQEFLANYAHKECYITYRDSDGNTDVVKARLFYAQHQICYFPKGKSASGYPIRNNWVRIDYFEK